VNIYELLIEINDANYRTDRWPDNLKDRIERTIRQVLDGDEWYHREVVSDLDFEIAKLRRTVKRLTPENEGGSVEPRSPGMVDAAMRRWFREGDDD